MGDSKILLNDIPDLRDGFITIYFMLRQFRSPDGLGHNAVGDLIQIKELSVMLSKIAFIGIHFLDGLSGMTTAGNAKRKIGTVMVGGRGHFRSKNKPVTGINGSMLFETIMGDVIFNRPVRFEITGKLKEVAIFIQLSLRCFFFFFSSSSFF